MLTQPVDQRIELWPVDKLVSTAATRAETTLPWIACGRALKKLRPNTHEAQRTFAGKVEWVYLGIGLKTPQDLHPVHEMSNEISSDDSRGSRDSRDLPFFNLSREEDR